MGRPVPVVVNGRVEVWRQSSSWVTPGKILAVAVMAFMIINVGLRVLSLPTAVATASIAPTDVRFEKPPTAINLMALAASVVAMPSLAPLGNLEQLAPLGALQAIGNFPSVDSATPGWFREVNDPYLNVEIVRRLNVSWPQLVIAARENNVPPWCLAFLHYQESIPHCALFNPRNGEGIFQLHDYVITGQHVFPYTGKLLSGAAILHQARLAADFLQKKSGGRLTYEMLPFDPVVIDAVYGYNGRTYADINHPSESLKSKLMILGIQLWEYARSPYVVGRLTPTEAAMFLRTIGWTKIGFYGYIPFVLKLQETYQAG